MFIVHSKGFCNSAFCIFDAPFITCQFLLWNPWTEFNKIWQEGSFQRPPPSLCFAGPLEKQDGLPDLWSAETFSTSPLNPLNRIQQNLTGSKISTSSTNFVFFGPIGKTRWLPWPLISWDISKFSSKPLNGIQWNMTGSKISTSSAKFVFFRPIGKTKWLPGLSVTETFQFFLWNHWMEINESWQEARSQHPLPSLCFLGPSVNKTRGPRGHCRSPEYNEREKNFGMDYKLRYELMDWTGWPFLFTFQPKKHKLGRGR